MLPELHAGGGGFGNCPKETVFFLGFFPLGNRSDVDVDPDLCFSGNIFLEFKLDNFWLIFNRYILVSVNLSVKEIPDAHMIYVGSLPLRKVLSLIGGNLFP